MSRTITSLPIRPLGALTLLVAMLAAVLLPAGAADAAAYRYWGYYQLAEGSWEFAATGPADTKPADGSVEGWRFAVGTEESTRLPRATATFEEICADTDAESGKKRVGVVIDYGRAADGEDGAEPPAPVARCASVDAAATGLEVLVAVADVRQDAGLICGIDDYPGAGCGGEVKTVSAEAAEPDTAVELDLTADTEAVTPSAEEDDSDTGTWIGIGVAVLALAAVAVAALRRRGA